MVIIDYKAGQLANRLFHFSYFIANSLEHNYKLVNTGFKEYADLFVGGIKAEKYFGKKNIKLQYHKNSFINNYYNRFATKIKTKAKRNNGKYLFAKIHSIKAAYDAQYKEFDMNDDSFVDKAKKKWLFTVGWNYRDHSNFLKYSSEIKEIFTPVDEYNNIVLSKINMLRKEADFIIGVHIRRGDYKTFFEGIWFYEDEFYYKKMAVIKEELKAQGKTCSFLICSNEKINTANFKDLKIDFESREAIIDLYCLAKCDFIIGPPSTFTMWASFYGNAPLNIMKNKHTITNINEFKISTGIESFF